MHLSEVYHEFGPVNGGVIKLNIKPSLFDAAPDVDYFIIKGFVSEDGINFGMAGLCMRALRPPKLGSCSLSSAVQKSITDEIKIECEGFENLNGDEALTYQIIGIIIPMKDQLRILMNVIKGSIMSFN